MYRFMGRKNSEVAGERRFRGYDLDKTIDTILFKSYYSGEESRDHSQLQISNADPCKT